MDEEYIIALKLMQQAATHWTQFQQTLAQASTLNAMVAKNRKEGDDLSSGEELDGPGRRHTADGEPK